MSVYGELPDPLSRDAERKASKHDLVLHNLPFALRQASAYRRRVHALEKEDLQQIAALGMCEAAKRYKPIRGYRFNTYAGYRIRKEVQDAVRIQARYRRKADTAHEHVAERSPTDPAVILEQKEMLAWVERAVGELRPQWRRVVRMRVGMEPFDRPHTFREIGLSLRVTGQRAKQIFADGVAQLRRAYLREVA